MPETTTPTQAAEEQQDRQAEEQQARQADAAERAMPCPINYDPRNPASLYMDRGSFRQIFQVGQMLAASMLVPDHLKKKAADCALIVAQAFRWGLDPLAVAQHTYVVYGKLGYEGKLIAALVNVSGKTQGPLRYAYSGDGMQRRIVVTGRLLGETEDRTVEGTVQAWHTLEKGSVADRWKSNADAMLRYRGAREWARAHMPEVILGIQAEDEIPAPVVEFHGQTPAAAGGPDPLAEQLKSQRAAQAAAAAPVATAPVTPAAPEPPPSREPGEDDDEPTPGPLAGPLAQAAEKLGIPAPDPFQAARKARK